MAFRARLAEQKGYIDAAAVLQAAAVKEAPSWQNLLGLADLEARRGHIARARSSIDQILAQDPGNPSVKEALGKIELSFGDLARAEQIFQDGIRSAPQRSLDHLGTVRLLRGHFAGAADAFRRALAFQPDDVTALVNLANAEIELGQRLMAEAHYDHALTLLDKRAGRLDPADALRKALCLARLGRSREAVEHAKGRLRPNSDTPQLLLQRALVYRIAGERAMAVDNALAALDQGLHPRWFAGSILRKLSETPRIRSRLRE